MFHIIHIIAFPSQKPFHNKQTLELSSTDRTLCNTQKCRDPHNTKQLPTTEKESLHIVKGTIHSKTFPTASEIALNREYFRHVIT